MGKKEKLPLTMVKMTEKVLPEKLPPNQEKLPLTMVKMTEKVPPEKLPPKKLPPSPKRKKRNAKKEKISKLQLKRKMTEKVPPVKSPPNQKKLPLTMERMTEKVPQ